MAFFSRPSASAVSFAPIAEASARPRASIPCRLGEHGLLVGLGLLRALEGLGLGLTLTRVQGRVGLLLGGVALGVGLRVHLGLQGLLGDDDFLLLDDRLLLLLDDVGLRGLALDVAALDLRLDFVGGVGLCLLGVGLDLECGLALGEVRLLLGDLQLGGDLSVVGFLLGDGGRLRDLLLRVRLGDGGGLADLLGVVDTEVVDDAVLIGHVLDVEGNDLQAHLLQVLLGVFLDALGEGGAVGDDVGELHLADDGAQVAFECVADFLGDFGGCLVEEVTSRRAEQCRVIGGDTDLDGCVDAHVDVVVRGHVVRGLGVDGDHRGGHGVHALEEGEFPPRFTVEDALAARTGDDLDFARRGGHEARPEEQE